MPELRCRACAQGFGNKGLKLLRVSFETFRLARLAAVLGVVACTAALATVSPASAQSWWPFGGEEERRPVPREPMNRPQPQQIPAPIPGQPPQMAPQAAPQPGVSPGAPGATNWATKNPICLQLEQRLVQEGQKGNQSQARLPQIETEIRTVDRNFNVGASQLDKTCYEYFLFTKSFRNTPQCKELAKQVDVAKRRLSELEAQRQEAMGSAGRSYKDDIIRELARNNCGANYADQARRRDGGVWQDEETVGNSTWTPQGTSGVATYRTLCVRLCDGYYFPVSFSTLPSHFPQDAEVCSSKCAAPTELYYYPNPGGSVDQSVALKSQENYTKLKVAFRYRKEYVNGCSCKEAEYVPANGVVPDKKAEGGAAPATPKTSAFPPRRADAGGAGVPLTTGSTSVPAAPAAPGSGWEAKTEQQ
ncbi:MAG: DUF2865 domain-containing protein [Hyphomicrobium sp.]|nr:DUF2865 domain-containing protein [Hyphomicrobium sp.]